MHGVSLMNGHLSHGRMLATAAELQHAQNSYMHAVMGTGALPKGGSPLDLRGGGSSSHLTQHICCQTHGNRHRDAHFHVEMRLHPHLQQQRWKVAILFPARLGDHFGEQLLQPPQL